MNHPELQNACAEMLVKIQEGRNKLGTPPKSQDIGGSHIIHMTPFRATRSIPVAYTGSLPHPTRKQSNQQAMITSMEDPIYIWLQANPKKFSIGQIKFRVKQEFCLERESHNADQG